jgi:hypothetical protein
VVVVPPDSAVVVVEPAPVDFDRMPTTVVVVVAAPDPLLDLAVVGVTDGAADVLAVVVVVAGADDV